MGSQDEYYCVFIRRNSDKKWVPLAQFDNYRQAEKVMFGMFARHTRYNRANLRVLSASQAKQEFGPDWDFRQGFRQ